MDVTELFKSLSDPLRLRIMLLLASTEPELCVCDIVSVTGAPQGTVSRHLGHLRLVGLVNDRRDGTWVYYRLSKPVSKVHRAMVNCLKTCFADDPVLSKDLKQYLRLKKTASLACCSGSTSEKSAPNARSKRSS